MLLYSPQLFVKNSSPMYDYWFFFGSNKMTNVLTTSYFSDGIARIYVMFCPISMQEMLLKTDEERIEL